MAYAYKPKQSKTWRIAFYDPITRKLTSISAHTYNQAEAKRQARDLSAKHRLRLTTSNLINNPNRQLTIFQALKIYSSHKKLKEKSNKAYRIACEHLIAACGDKPLFQFNKSDNLILHQHLNDRKINRGKSSEKKLSTNSIANYTRHLYSLFKWLKEQDFIHENIISKTKTELKKVEVISEQDLELIFSHSKKHCEKRNSDLILLKYYAAYRAQELLMAKAEDFDFKNKIVTINNFKANRQDQIPMVNDLFEHLKQMNLPPSGRITELKYEGLRSVWDRLMDRLQMNYSLHQLRKTRGTQLANKGVNPIFLQKFMRHENIKTTMDYYIRIDLMKMEKEINEKLI